MDHRIIRKGSSKKIVGNSLVNLTLKKTAGGFLRCFKVSEEISSVFKIMKPAESMGSPSEKSGTERSERKKRVSGADARMPGVWPDNNATSNN